MCEKVNFIFLVCLVFYVFFSALDDTAKDTTSHLEVFAFDEICKSLPGYLFLVFVNV